MAKYPEHDNYGKPRTPYAIHCQGPMPEYVCGLVYLTQAEYDRQMRYPDAIWSCPICRMRGAQWDDENYEEMREKPEPGTLA